jgi:hypothetical protein
MVVGKKQKKPEEEILLDDLRDAEHLLQVCRTDLHKVKNQCKLLRSFLVQARDNLSEAITRFDKMMEEI